MKPHVLEHPLAADRLAKLRDKATPAPAFRSLVHDLSTLLFIEATRDLSVTPTTVATPLASCPAGKISDTIGLFPILRAGLGMAQSILDLVPEAQVWHLGLYRDHDTLQPVTYYQKLTGNPSVTAAFVLDPMLATGGSAIAALTLLKNWGVTRVKFLSLIGAPEGVSNLHRAHPEVPIYLGALDDRLNELGYIVPGLGDAGDRQFAT